MNIEQYKNKSNLDYLLINAVIEQLGLDDNDDTGTLEDIANYGIDGGFSGFIYYSDKEVFYAENKELIIEQLKEDVLNYGDGDTSVINLVKTFNCVKNNEVTEDEIGQTLYSLNHDQTVVSCLAWYAAEVVAQDCLRIIEDE